MEGSISYSPNGLSRIVMGYLVYLFIMYGMVCSTEVFPTKLCTVFSPLSEKQNIELLQILKLLTFDSFA